MAPQQQQQLGLSVHSTAAAAAPISSAAAQRLPLALRQRIVELAIDARRRRFLDMLALAPEAYTSPLRRPQPQCWVQGNGGYILEESFGDLTATIRYDDKDTPGSISQVMVYAPGSIQTGGGPGIDITPSGREVLFSKCEHEVDTRCVTTRRMFAMLAIVIHRFLPSIDPATITYKPFMAAAAVPVADIMKRLFP